MMSITKTAAALALSALAAGVLLGAGAQQRSPRPFVPRPSDLRPIPSGQAAPIPPAGSATPSHAPAAGRPGDPPQKAGTLDADYWTMDEKTAVITARNFLYTVDDMRVTGAKGKYNKEKYLLDADGNLTLDDNEHHVTGDRAHVDDSAKAKVAVFTGNVVIVLKPKEKPATEAVSSDVSSEKSRGATITCDHVDDYYKKKFVILKGHLTFKQKITKQNGRTVERTLTAEHAEYDGKNNKLHLFAPVDGKDTEDQAAHFNTDVFVGTKEGEETLQSDGPGHITFKVDEEKDDGAQPDAKPAADGKSDGTSKPDTTPAPPSSALPPSTPGKAAPPAGKT
jgi:hypothetical protein